MNLVKNICELLREEVNVPVFEYCLPDSYNKECLVVNMASYDHQLEMGEYHINIYAPNREREVDGQPDYSAPDIDTIENRDIIVKNVLRGLWNSYYDINMVKSQLVKDGNMHYLNKSITIQNN